MDIQRDDLKQKILRRKKALWLVSGALLVVMIAVGFSLDPAAPSVARSALWIDSVQHGEMLREVRGPGLLVPKEIRWIAAETSARVERVVVKPGAVVEASTIILDLSNPEVEEALLSAKSAALAAQADYAAQKVSLESQMLDQRANLAAVEADFAGASLQANAEGELNGKGIISDLQFKQTELRANQLKLRVGIEKERLQKFKQNIAAQLAAQRARMQQLESTVVLRERQAQALQVKAGIDGVLQQIAVEEGQQVLAGSNLARVARPELLMAELRIAETQAKDIALGQSAKIDTRNGVAEGKVIRIDPAVNNGTVQVDVDIVSALPKGARPDLSIEGTIEIERLDDVLYVGRPAFGQSDSAITVFKLAASGNMAERVPVQLGKTSVNLVQILQGLEEGDQIILSDSSAWELHDRLKIE